MLAKFLKSALLGLCILIALLVALYAISARWPIPDAQRQALAQIDQPPAAPPAGSNLFAALWLLPYVVPATEQDVVMERDLQQFANARTAAVLSATQRAIRARRRGQPLHRPSATGPPQTAWTRCALSPKPMPRR